VPERLPQLEAVFRPELGRHPSIVVIHVYLSFTPRTRAASVQQKTRDWLAIAGFVKFFVIWLEISPTTLVATCHMDVNQWRAGSTGN